MTLEAPSSSSASDAGNAYYFAIGAMMNPNSIKNRNIYPISSFPAELFDFELKFNGALGFADAIPSKGSSFHGVLHLVDAETMSRLDALEISYKRVDGQARLYDGTMVTATVYTKDSFVSTQKDNPPQQRYLDLLIEGAKHFQLHEKQIKFLESHECVPRPQPHEFKSFGPAAEDAPLMSYENDICPFNGRDTPNLRLAVNGKVLEIFVKNVEGTLFRNSMNFYRQFGQRVELTLSRILYDPKYGCPESLEECTREQSAYIEHILHQGSEVNTSIDHWKVIGCILQEYKD
mmetsp:Transcript_11058/g.18901  ORF Transcript_11058/g.18901 Transcript_11058/m.18901 type:complete len:290 (+) Transcript_11058:22-891(+)